MMRRVFILLLVVAASATLFSCEKLIDDIWPASGPCIEITLKTGGDLETRAGNNGAMDGVDRYNENLISWVDFFFYPGGDTLNDATWHVRRVSGKRRSDVMRIDMTSEQINTLIFPTSPTDIRTCTVFAIANYPDTIVADESDLSGTSFEDLYALTVDSDFVSPSNHRQARFVMSGQYNLILRGRAQVVAAAATIDLIRYACKMTVGVHVADTVRIGKEVWRPMLSGMNIYLVNGVSDVTLGGRKEQNPTYFSYRNNPMYFAYTDMEEQLHFYFEKDGEFYNTYPSYMYPQKWDYGSNESPRKEPYLKLVVPWKRDADSLNNISSTQRQFYYKVVIPDDYRSEFKRSFVRNNWYHIDINVGILGSETDEAMVTIFDGWCYIEYWQDKDIVIKNAEIGKARYLSVEDTTYEFHNISDPVNLSYTSSHPVIIKDIHVTRPYYGEETSGDHLGGTVHKVTAGSTYSNLYPVGSYYLEYDEEQRRAINGGQEWLTNTGTAITFQHTINNNYTDTLFDYSPYTVSYTLVHSDRQDDTTFRKTIKVLQRPGIYIESHENSDRTSGYKYNGYVYVDNAQLKRPLYDSLVNVYVEQGETWDARTGGTVRWIPEMQDLQWRITNYTGGSRDIFLMNISVLPENSDFLIGDPRKSAVDNLYDVTTAFGTPRTFSTAPSLEEVDGKLYSTGEERTLTWYYPTDTSSRTRNLMAPAYRIASKFGGIEYYDGTPFAEAQYRCASYQEDGYPAGRWRLPTRGEIRFIAMLSANKMFTFLFSKNGYYWSANGAIHVLDHDVEDSPTKSTALTRCVYDTWFWGDGELEDRTIFTWGDRER